MYPSTFLCFMRMNSDITRKMYLLSAEQKKIE